MFACLVAGHWVITDCQQVDQFKFTISLGEVDRFGHIGVFLTGQVPLPAESAAAVYLNWPEEEKADNWIYLGHLSNDKPSAIFQVKKTNDLQRTCSDQATTFSTRLCSKQIGIQLIPIAQIIPTSPSTTTGKASAISTLESIKTVATNFLNYASSFAFCPDPNAPSEAYISLRVVNDWFQKCIAKLAHDPAYLSKPLSLVE